MKRLIALALLLATLFSAAPVVAAPTVPITHVVVIAMENHSRSQVIGSSQAPYITSLAQTYGQATDYVNLTHPSLPNYMDMTGGTNAGITTDCLPGASCGSNGASIFSQVSSWTTYADGMPSHCDKSNGGTEYVAHHNPAVYYRTLTSCSTNDVALPSSVSVAAAFTLVVPNECHDMHSSCSNCTVCQGDNWAKQWVPKFMATSQYQSGDTAIFIWWDENNKAAGGPLPFIVISPYTSKVSYTGKMDHYTFLRTVQDILGVGCLSNSCSRTSVATSFGLK